MKFIRRALNRTLVFGLFVPIAFTAFGISVLCEAFSAGWRRGSEWYDDFLSNAE